MMAAIESFTLNLEDNREKNIQAYDKVLQLIWEWEIVSEEDIRAWQVRCIGTLDRIGVRPARRVP